MLPHEGPGVNQVSQFNKPGSSAFVMISSYRRYGW